MSKDRHCFMVDTDASVDNIIELLNDLLIRDRNAISALFMHKVHKVSCNDHLHMHPLLSDESTSVSNITVMKLVNAIIGTVNQSDQIEVMVDESNPLIIQSFQLKE